MDPRPDSVKEGTAPQMTDTRILIVVKDPEAGKAYADTLSQLGVAYDVVSSFDRMWDLVVERPYNGLLVDILTLVRCSKEEKVIAYDCINLYPVLRVKWEAKNGRIKLGSLEQAFTPDADTALRSFIENRCRLFPPRQVRRHKRKPIHLNVLFSPDGSFDEGSCSRSFTVNLAPGGVFLHTMESFPVGATLWLRFVDLADQTPVAATVRWAIQWGESRSIPGVGLKLEGLSEQMEKELQRIYQG